MKSTLVIHPQDVTTDCLKVIYEDRPNWTIINSNIPSSHLAKAIKKYDRIVMLGHGTPQGLLGFGRFVIGSKLVYLLREKMCVGVWCNADQFFKKYNLRGFYTGMIISEVAEANYFNIDVDQETVTESNTLFSNCLKESIGSNHMLELMESSYVNKTNNPVIEYNLKNLYANGYEVFN